MPWSCAWWIRIPCSMLVVWKCLFPMDKEPTVGWCNKETIWNMTSEHLQWKDRSSLCWRQGVPLVNNSSGKTMTTLADITVNGVVEICLKGWSIITIGWWIIDIFYSDSCQMLMIDVQIDWTCTATDRYILYIYICLWKPMIGPEILRTWNLSM